MSGVTPLVDTLLATRLAQRVDLVPLKAQLEIPGPGAPNNLEKVSNDVRLPSREALQQQIGVGLAGKDGDGKAARPASSDASVSLSAVARAISAILGPQADGQALRLRGSEALWPHGRAPLVNVLGARLARAVSGSGLFYESHLRQHASGALSLTQLLREPQASLSRPELAAVAELDLAEADAQPALLALRSLAASADSGSPATAAIHPEALGLVRQQLELLAQPMFRWGGEAWPGAAMDWDIHQQADERGDPAELEPESPAWTTHLKLRLPMLKGVDVRLTLSGNSLQVQLNASEDATLVLLGQGRQVLSERFGAAGLQLNGWQIGPQLAGSPIPGGDA